MKNKMRWFGALTGMITAGAAAVTGGVFRYTFYFSRKQWEKTDIPTGSQYHPYRELAAELIEKISAIAYEEVWITSFDRLRLFGKYYHNRDGAPLAILCHGYHGKAERDFCGGFWLAQEAGCNILLIDERAHGNSEGHVITFGVKERRDVKSWVDYALSRFGEDTEILLVGVSMGASTVLLATELDLPSQVKGIIADCGYTTPKKIICRTAADRGYPPKLLYPVIRLGAILFGGFDPDAVSVPEALRHCEIPVLLIHGEDDRFVSCEMSRENYAACASEKTLLIVPEAGHTLAYMVDTPKYRDAFFRFAQSVLN